MCCARTAALQGGYEKQKVNASRNVLQQSLHHVLTSCESYAKYVVCTHVRHAPKSTKHRKNCGFVAGGEFLDARLLTPKIIDKCGFEGSKALPRPPKIESAATPSPKKTTNMSQKCARSV